MVGGAFGAVVLGNGERGVDARTLQLAALGGAALPLHSMVRGASVMLSPNTHTAIGGGIGGARGATVSLDGARGVGDAHAIPLDGARGSLRALIFAALGGENMWWCTRSRRRSRPATGRPRRRRGLRRTRRRRTGYGARGVGDVRALPPAALGGAALPLYSMVRDASVTLAA